MKKFRLLTAMLLLCVMLFSLFSCEEYYYASKVTDPTGKEPDEYGQGGSTQPVLNDNPADDFTVTVMVNGEAYSPRMDMDVYWKDGTSVHTAPLNENGVARIDGLDGDYRVSLSALPNELSYDPNSTIATNDNRNVILELYPLEMKVGSGMDEYNCYSISDTGAYSTTINSPEEKVFFQYAPSAQGVYTIESWVDTMSDTVNPYIDVYTGSSAYKQYSHTINDGGAVGSYTINFVHTIEILSEQISAGGQQVYTFAVRAESKYNQYPLTLTFAVKLNDEIEPKPIRPPSSSYQTAIPELDFSTYNVLDHEYGDEYTMTYPEYRFAEGSNVYVFNEKNVKLWKKKDGGDDFYHMYDEEKYADNNGYGPILYANITSDMRFIGVVFSVMEYGDENGLGAGSHLSVNGYNYKHFIEGYSKLMSENYYCKGTCTNTDHTPSDSVNGVCTEECTLCTDSCKKCPKALIGNEGYQSIVNSDGAVAVTEEIKEFLYNFATSPKTLYFRDGIGYIDGSEWNGKWYQAPTGSEWLFTCFYYKKS